MRINPAQVFADKAKREAEVKPLPKVVFKLKAKSDKAESLPEPKVAAPAQLSALSFELSAPPEKPELKELWNDMARVKKQRDMLSTRTVPLIAELEAKLMEQSPAYAAEFMNGNLPMAELAAHYASIQSFTDQAKAIYDKIVYVEQYGHLPSPQGEGPGVRETESSEASALKYEIRRLDDVIYKTNKKIAQSKGGIKGPKNSGRVLEWQDKVAMAIISRDDLKVKLKRMRNGNLYSS